MIHCEEVQSQSSAKNYTVQSAFRAAREYQKALPGFFRKRNHQKALSRSPQKRFDLELMEPRLLFSADLPIDAFAVDAIVDPIESPAVDSLPDHSIDAAIFQAFNVNNKTFSPFFVPNATETGSDIAINSTYQDALLNGLDNLVNWAKGLAKQEELAGPIGGLSGNTDVSAGAAMDIAEALDQLRVHLNEFFDTAENPTAADLVDFFSNFNKEDVKHLDRAIVSSEIAPDPTAGQFSTSYNFEFRVDGESHSIEVLTGPGMSLQNFVEAVNQKLNAADIADKVGAFIAEEGNPLNPGAPRLAFMAIDPEINELEIAFDNNAQDVFGFHATEKVSNIKQTLSGLGDLNVSIANGVTLDVVRDDQGITEIRFNVQLNADRTSRFQLDLGQQNGLDIEFDSQADIDLHTHLDADFALGLNLTDSPEFFLDVEQLIVNLQINPDDTQNIDSDVNFGFLGAHATGSLSLDSLFNVEFTGENGGSGLTISDLNPSDIADLVTITSEGSDLDINLAVTVKTGLGFDPEDLAITANDLDPLQTNDLALGFSDGFEELFQFGNLNPENLINLLKELSSTLNAIGQSDVFSSLDIPFVESTLSSILNLQNFINVAILADNQVENPSSNISALVNSFEPTFHTAQELAGKLAQVLGVDLEAIGAQYDAETDSLTYNLDLSDILLGSFDVPIEFDIDLGPLGDISSQSNVKLEARGGLSLTMGLYLGEGDAGTLIDSDTLLSDLLDVENIADVIKVLPAIMAVQPSKPKLTGDASFDIQVGDFDSVTVNLLKQHDNTRPLLPDTNDNTNILDLAADLSIAFQDILLSDNQTLLSDVLDVGVSGDRLVITSKDGSSFTLTADGTSVSDLGFDQSQTSNSADLFIYTQDRANPYEITLDGAETVQDLIDAVNDQTDGNVILEINEQGIGFNLKHSSLSSGIDRVSAANGSPAAFLLGIFAADPESDRNGDGVIDAADKDGVVEGSAIAGITLSDRLFIEDAVINANFSVTTPDGITAAANFGFVGIELSGNGSVAGSFEAGFKDAETGEVGGRLSLQDLYDGMEDIDTLLGVDYQGSADFDLGVELVDEAGIGDLISSMGATPHVSVHLDDINDLNDIDLDFDGLGDLLKFDSIGFDEILAGIRTLSDFLGQFESFGFLDDPIPVVDISFNEFLTLAEDFNSAINAIEKNPAGSLQTLESALEDAFGLSENRDLLNLSLVSNEDLSLLRIDLHLDEAFQELLGIEFDLGDVGVLTGAADLLANGTIAFDLSVGINLDFDSENDQDQVYVFDNTGVTGLFLAAAQGISFRAGVGPLGIFVKGGSVSLGGNLDENNKIFDLGFEFDGTGTEFTVDGETVEAKSLNEVLDDLSSNIEAQLSGELSASLPVFFPTDSTLAGTIEFAADLSLDALSGELELPDFSDSLNVVFPDGREVFGAEALTELFTFDLESLSLIDKILLAADGLDLLLGGIQDVLEGEVFAFKLPLIGDQLSGAAHFIDDFRQDFIEPFRAAIENAANPNQNIISQLLFDLLEDTGLLLWDHDGDSSTDPISIGSIIPDLEHVIQLTTNVDQPGPLNEQFMQWNFVLGGSIAALSADIGFDLGIPGLGLKTEGSVDLNIDWHLNLGFGISYEDGFYIDISSTNELGIDLEVTIPDFAITGQLAFMQLRAEENEGNEDDYTHLGATFAVDISNKNDEEDERLALSEFRNIDFTPGIAAEAIADLHMDLSVNSDLIPIAAVFPKISADFFMEWEIGNWGGGQSDNQTFVPFSEIDKDTIKEGLQLVEFRDVSLDLGSLVSDFIQPILGRIKSITEPLQPIVNIITSPLPVLSQLGLNITPLDLAEMFGRKEVGFIKSVANIISLINSIPTDADGIVINFGDYVIFDADNSAGNMIFGGAENNDSDEPMGILSRAMATSGGSGAPSFQDQLNSSGASGSTKNFFSKLASSGFQLPILTDPSQVFNLLLGKEATLFSYDILPLSFNFTYKQYFPIFGPLGATIKGSLNATIDLHSVGFDTSGIMAFANSGYSNPELIFNGFFISDLNKGGQDSPELTFGGSLTAAAGLNIGVAEVGVQGGIFAGVYFDLFDPNRDGKIRINELIGNMYNEAVYGSPALAPLAIFDVSGEIYARLFAYIEIDLFFFEFYREFNILPKITLVEFGTDFYRPPILATELDGGVLQLNMGENAGERLNGNLADGSEAFYMEQAGNGKVKVWAPGLGVGKDRAQTYSVSSTIIARGGNGHDIIDLSGVTGNYNFMLEGGDGNDLIKAGSGTGKAVISGDDGRDTLFGGNGNDEIIAGFGNDEIRGRGGSDIIFGDNGKLTDEDKNGRVDVVSVRLDATDGDDIIYGDGGIDYLFGGAGIDVIDGGDSTDYLIGDNGLIRFNSNGTVSVVDNTNRGAFYGKDRLSGQAGDDFLYGGRDDDQLDGGNDQDLIYGEDGFDVIQGGGGEDVIYGGLDNDTISGGGGNDTIYGELGQDLIHGDDGQDTVYGGRGADTIYGDAGDDTVYGEHDADSIFGGSGDDFINGNAGDDYVRGDSGNDTIVGEAGNDTIFGDDDDDTITGNLGNDYIQGNHGQDSIKGNEGDDVILGDNGVIAFGDDDNLATLDRISTSGNMIVGDNDFIEGNSGRDIILGGVSDDVILGGTENDIILGDGGEIILLATVVSRIISTDTSKGGSDEIKGNDGDDILIGGFNTGTIPTNNADAIEGNSGHDIVVGDNAVIDLNQGIFGRIESIDPGIGGSDTIRGHDGNDIILGGAAGDFIDAGEQDNIVIGDNAKLTATGGKLDEITTIAPTVGGSDTIVSGAGDDLIIGGQNGDDLNAGQGNNIAVGDNGNFVYAAGILSAWTSTDFTVGGQDKIVAGDGNDILIGGYDADTITANQGNNVILGDNSTLSFLDDGNGSTLDLIETTATGVGENDVINSGDGNDVVLAGFGNDIVDVAHGANIVVADNGRITGASGNWRRVETLAPDQGGNDEIDSGDGLDIIIGGYANDTIRGGDGNNIVLGDNGYLSWVSLDNDPNDVDVITTTDPNLGGLDTILTGSGNDMIIAGTEDDSIIAGDGNDLIFGDHAMIAGDVDASLLPLHQPIHPFVFTAIFTANDFDGGSDTVHGNGGHDIIIGQQGDDHLFGEDGDDDLVGGHNVADGHDGNDEIDGGSGDDVIAGDNASILRRGDNVSQYARVLIGGTLYAIDPATGYFVDGYVPAVKPEWQSNPVQSQGRDVELFNHSYTPNTGTWGSDYIAGGSQDDMIFGQLGNDTIQGDGSTGIDVFTLGHSVADWDTDGDDYIEGNGGEDLIYGNKGQDDIIGGSSNMFGLITADLRPDQSDTIFGGSGEDVTRNTLGDTSANGHAHDADTILGDNGNIFRIVGRNGVDSGSYLTFNYDNYGSIRIVVRAVELLDYQPGGSASDIGAADELHGEAGDDTLHGAAGNDVLYGESQDDDLLGEAGADWLFGGSGEDGLLGDDGKIFTSRNGVAEPLFGIAAAAQEYVETPFHSAHVNVSAELKKAVDLEPFAIGSNDVMYGGLGNDSLHGGAGDDMISGAEARQNWYDKPVPGEVEIVLFDTAAQDFKNFDDNNPLQGAVKQGASDPAFIGNDFVLSWDAKKTDGSDLDDGQDALFGDLGNDWLVGGTNRDNLFGGFGNDMHDTDDNRDNITTEGRTDDFYADIAFGGDGRDTLVANTGEDRLLDWSGEYNAYAVPFSPFGAGTITRSGSPAIREFLYKLSESDGADQTRIGAGPDMGTAERNGEPYGELGLVMSGDSMWSEQHGGPSDPQPGNGSGGKDQRNPGTPDGTTDTSGGGTGTGSGNGKKK